MQFEEIAEHDLFSECDVCGEGHATECCPQLGFGDNTDSQTQDLSRHCRGESVMCVEMVTPPNAVHSSALATTQTHRHTISQGESVMCVEMVMLQLAFGDNTDSQTHDLSRARKTLPSNLSLQEFPDGSVGVLAKENISNKTHFGPFEARWIADTIPDRSLFVLKVFNKDGTVITLDSSNEDECNWMCLIRCASSVPDYNCMAYQLGVNIFYSTIRDVVVGEELRVWYAKFYSRKLGRLPVPDGLTDAMLGKEITITALGEPDPEDFAVATELAVAGDQLEEGAEFFDFQDVPDTESIQGESVDYTALDNHEAGFACDRCNQTFIKEIEYAEHVRAHFEPQHSKHVRKIKKFQCQVCHVSFDNSKSLLKHSASCSNDITIEIISCVQCNYQTLIIEEMVEHMKSLHDMDWVPPSIKQRNLSIDADVVSVSNDTGLPVKRKRGRPRKVTREVNQDENAIYIENLMSVDLDKSDLPLEKPVLQIEKSDLLLDKPPVKVKGNVISKLSTLIKGATGGSNLDSGVKVKNKATVVLELPDFGEIGKCSNGAIVDSNTTTDEVNSGSGVDIPGCRKIAPKGNTMEVDTPAEKTEKTSEIDNSSQLVEVESDSDIDDPLALEVMEESDVEYDPVAVQRRGTRIRKRTPKIAESDNVKRQKLARKSDNLNTSGNTPEKDPEDQNDVEKPEPERRRPGRRKGSKNKVRTEVIKPMNYETFASAGGRLIPSRKNRGSKMLEIIKKAASRITRVPEVISVPQKVNPQSTAKDVNLDVKVAIEKITVTENPNEKDVIENEENDEENDDENEDFVNVDEPADETYTFPKHLVKTLKSTEKNDVEDEFPEINETIQIVDETKPKVAYVRGKRGRKAKPINWEGIITEVGENSETVYTCKMCYKKFSEVKKCELHVRIHVNKTRCKYCGDVLKSTTIEQHECRIQIVEGVDTETGAKVLVCLECNATFSNVDETEYHYMTHIGEFHCKLCTKRFGQHHLLMTHVCAGNQNDDVEGEFNCMICKQTFKYARYLYRHMALHTNTFKCTNCERCFSRKDSMQRHILQCDPERAKTESIYQCQRCGRPFATESGLNHHAIKCGKNTCINCGIAFLREDELDTHACEMPDTYYMGKPRFQCMLCDVSCLNAKYLLRHEVVHTDAFSCLRCSKTFSRKLDHEWHISACDASAIIQENGKIICDRCHEEFTDPLVYRDHYYIHTNPHRCEKCGKRFVKQGSLYSHKCIGVKVNQCQVCQKMFRSERYLQRHMIVHQKPEYECEVCKKVFNRPDFIYEHTCKLPDGTWARVVRRKTGTFIREGVVCDLCGKRFSTKSNLAKHRVTHLEREQECDVCHKKFHHERYMIEHKATVHDNARAVTCPKCGKVLKSKASLFAHNAQFHQNKPLFKCSVCDKTFRQKGNLKCHMFSHSANKTFECEYCHKKFKYPDQLARHRLQHTMSDKLNCPMCDKHFVKTYELKSHISAMHSGQLYVCSLCSTKCTHRLSLVRHFRRKHPTSAALLEKPGFIESLLTDKLPPSPPGMKHTFTAQDDAFIRQLMQPGNDRTETRPNFTQFDTVSQHVVINTPETGQQTTVLVDQTGLEIPQDMVEQPTNNTDILQSMIQTNQTIEIPKHLLTGMESENGEPTMVILQIMNENGEIEEVQGQIEGGVATITGLVNENIETIVTENSDEQIMQFMEDGKLVISQNDENVVIQQNIDSDGTLVIDQTINSDRNLIIENIDTSGNILTQTQNDDKMTMEHVIDANGKVVMQQKFKGGGKLVIRENENLDGNLIHNQNSQNNLLAHGVNFIGENTNVNLISHNGVQFKESNVITESGDGKIELQNDQTEQFQIITDDGMRHIITRPSDFVTSQDGSQFRIVQDVAEAENLEIVSAGYETVENFVVDSQMGNLEIVETGNI